MVVFRFATFLVLLMDFCLNEMLLDNGRVMNMKISLACLIFVQVWCNLLGFLAVLKRFKRFETV